MQCHLQMRNHVPTRANILIIGTIQAWQPLVSRPQNNMNQQTWQDTYSQTPTSISVNWKQQSNSEDILWDSKCLSAIFLPLVTPMCCQKRGRCPRKCKASIPPTHRHIKCLIDALSVRMVWFVSAPSIYVDLERQQNVENIMFFTKCRTIECTHAYWRPATM